MKQVQVNLGRIKKVEFWSCFYQPIFKNKSNYRYRHALFLQRESNSCSSSVTCSLLPYTSRILMTSSWIQVQIQNWCCKCKQLRQASYTWQFLCTFKIQQCMCNTERQKHLICLEWKIHIFTDIKKKIKIDYQSQKINTAFTLGQKSSSTSPRSIVINFSFMISETGTGQFRSH